jgi:hypothetical protein
MNQDQKLILLLFMFHKEVNKYLTTWELSTEVGLLCPQLHSTYVLKRCNYKHYRTEALRVSQLPSE